ncbi:hypothetical protein IAU59_002833 [Kwoniella sp. CBS 9459]
MPRAQATAQRRSNANKSRKPISSTPLKFQPQLRRSARAQHAESPSLSLSQLQSLSQEQTQTQTQLEQSFISISTASLPNKYEINLALPADIKLTDTQKEEAYVRGEELLSDGWRKSTDAEGRLRELRKAQQLRRRKVTLPVCQDNNQSGAADITSPGKRGPAERDQTLWYTADLAFPCVCLLSRLKHAYSFSCPPPTSISLGALTPPDNHDVRAGHVPDSIPDLLDWSTSTTIDLEPSLDDIIDFEHLWADPPILLVSPASQVSENGTVVELEESPAVRRERKGKYRAIDARVDVDIPTFGLEQLVHTDAYSNLVEAVSKRGSAVPIGIPRVISPTSAEAEAARLTRSVQTTNAAWEEESRRRKSWWRGVIRNDAGYGKIWEILPLPYSHPVRPLPKRKKKKKRLKPTIPPYKLPRAYLSQIPRPDARSGPDLGDRYPFHPSLLGYIEAFPRHRVYWLIPLHGPVLIPTLNHPLDGDPRDHMRDRAGLHAAENDMESKEKGKIVPSMGYFRDSTIARMPGDINTQSRTKSVKPAPLEWTSSTLLSFINNFLHPLHLDPTTPLGNISYAFSGPKPDPFLDLPSARPLDQHLVVRSASSLPAVDGGDKLIEEDRIVPAGDTLQPKIVTDPNTVVRPVRPEAGDHLRIYCDASHALPLRTWLHNVRLPISMSVLAPDIGRNHETDKGGTEALKETEKGVEEIRVFYKTRLTLVGDRGEVLMVA